MKNTALTKVFQVLLVFISFVLCFHGYRLSNSTDEIIRKIGQVDFALNPETDSLRIAAQNKTLAAVKEVYDKTASFIKEANSGTMYYFIAGAGLLLLAFLFPVIQTFKIGPSGIDVTLRELQNEVRQIKDVNNANNKFQGDFRIPALRKDTIAIDRTTKGIYHDDAQKGLWGGRPESNNRKLSADFETTDAGYCKVFLRVFSTDNQHYPLNGTVKFHLHDIFPNPDPIIFVQNGMAELTLLTRGAFTVGAEADEGNTRLELDLSTVAAAPDLMKKVGSP